MLGLLKQNMENIKEEIKKLKELFKKNKYEVLVVNTYTGQNWDNPESKRFALIVGKTQLNPFYLKSLGFDSHYRKSVAEAKLFYDGVLGMSRAFNIVYHLSQWLYKDGYKLKHI